jgi:predicted AlkP superfamily pyrophosphatase or phosphodiesterase
MFKRLSLLVAVTSALVLGVFVVLHGQVAATKPKLLLVLSIDQMRFDYLTRFNSLYKGGLRRLLDQGAVFTNAKYRHANTETGPGHSVILSGRHASHSGIVANSWYDPLLKKSINVVDDPVQMPVGGKGRGASPTNFIGFTVGDVLKRDSPQSRVVGVSMKDRSAILMGGRRADAAYWFENEGGNFIQAPTIAPRRPSG